MQIVGDHHIIEGNDISHARGVAVLHGAHNVMRNNTWHDTVNGDCVIGGNGSNCHMDTYYADATSPGYAQFILDEGNTVHDLSADVLATGIATRGGPLLQAEVCAGNCFNDIFRFNVAYHVGGGGITGNNDYNNTVPGWNNVKVYNNDWIDINTVSYTHLTLPTICSV